MRKHLSGTARGLILVTAIFAVAGCGLPRSGPNKAEIFKGSVLKEGDAFVVTVNPRVTRATSVVPALGFGSNFRNAGVLGSDTISAGDTLSLTIFENVKDDPLLGNTGQRVSVLDTVQVDGQGFIFVPYAGRIKAAGNSPEVLRMPSRESWTARPPILRSPSRAWRVTGRRCRCREGLARRVSIRSNGPPGR